MALNQLIPSFSPFPSTNNMMDWADNLSGSKSPTIAGNFRINGLAFDYAGEVKSELTADITEHYMEDNSFVQDHVALRPRRVVMKGLIGELVAGPDQSGIPGLLQNLQNKLTVIPNYLGGRTNQYLSKASKAVQQSQKVASQLTAIYNTGKNIYSLVKGGSPSPTRQGQIYAALESLWTQRVPFLILTPFCTYDSMVIESMMAVQPEDTKFLSEFTVTLKEIRRASLLQFSAPDIAAAGKSRVTKNAQQANPAKNKGRNVPKSIPYVKDPVTGAWKKAGVK